MAVRGAKGTESEGFVVGLDDGGSGIICVSSAWLNGLSNSVVIRGDTHV